MIAPMILLLQVMDTLKELSESDSIYLAIVGEDNLELLFSKGTLSYNYVIPRTALPEDYLILESVLLDEFRHAATEARTAFAVEEAKNVTLH